MFWGIEVGCTFRLLINYLVTAHQPDYSFDIAGFCYLKSSGQNIKFEN